MRWVRRFAAALLAPALLGGAGSVGLMLLGPAAPVSAATTPCVGVVVDGRLAGGALRTGCADGDPGSGLEALTDAGFSYAFVPRQPGQVCQIDSLPDCARNSADSYWSYWWRAPGSRRWVYASEGAGSHDPAPGAIEGWVWQQGGRRQPPGIALTTVCPQARTRSTPKPTARPTTSAEAVPLPDLTKTPADLKPTEPLSAEPTTSSPPPPSATTSAPVSTTATASVARSEPPTRAAEDGSGPPWTGLVVGAALVAVLGGAALARSRRPRGTP